MAQVPFDEFHRYSTTIIKKAVFGVDKDGNVKERLRFDANQLVRKEFYFLGNCALCETFVSAQQLY